MLWPQVRGTFLFSPQNDDQEKKALLKCAELIRKGELVAFPTETVYGLGADALSYSAAAKIFSAKGRPADNPLIVHVEGIEQASALVMEMPKEAIVLARYFWPGPLTMILPKNAMVPDTVTAGLDSVALRVPSHLLALKLLRAARVPIAAPSANISGSPSPTTAAHVIADLAGRIAGVLDGGPCSVGLESTVLSLLTSPPTLLRPGWVTKEMLEKILNTELIDRSGTSIPEDREAPVLSPGMKYRHYAPAAPLFLVEGEGEELRRQIAALSEEYIAKGSKLGLLLSRESADAGLGAIAAPGASAKSAGEPVSAPSASLTALPASSSPPAPTPVVEILGSRDDPAAVGKRLFYALRRMDFLGVDVIVAEGYGEEDLGRAVMNRLRKAAAKIIKV